MAIKPPHLRRVLVGILKNTKFSIGAVRETIVCVPCLSSSLFENRTSPYVVREPVWNWSCKKLNGHMHHQQKPVFINITMMTEELEMMRMTDGYLNCQSVDRTIWSLPGTRKNFLPVRIVDPQMDQKRRVFSLTACDAIEQRITGADPFNPFSPHETR